MVGQPHLPHAAVACSALWMCASCHALQHAAEKKPPVADIHLKWPGPCFSLINHLGRHLCWEYWASMPTDEPKVSLWLSVWQKKGLGG